MSTFDGWETRLCGDAMAFPSGGELMHFRTKGSKNGVRRYQTESGEWTPLGLKERKAREGWGDGKAERKAAKEARKAARTEKKALRAEKRSEKIEARKARMAAFKEERRKKDVRNLTDAELRQRIERAKMENEYRELTKSPLLKTGEKFATRYLENRALKEQRKYEEQKATVEYAREMQKLQEQTKQKQIETDAAKAKAKADAERAAADKARAEADITDIKSGTRAQKQKNDANNLKLQKKRFVADNTIRGGIRKKFNAISVAKGQGRAEKIKESSFVTGILRGKRRIDRHNKKFSLMEQDKTLKYDPNMWDRDKNNREKKKENEKNKKK